MRIRTLFAGLAAVVMLTAAGPAYACSKDDTSYFETFLDTTCLQSLTNTELDALGGLRLSTTGAGATATDWDTDAHFDTGITYQATAFGPIGARTLATIDNGGAAPATLELAASAVPLVRDGANPVLSPTPSTVLDNDNVTDPAVVFLPAASGGPLFVMFYAGTAEDGSGPAIFRAVSQDGRVWKRSDEPVATPFATVDGASDAPVLTGDSGYFDANGVFGPDVIFDASAPAAERYKMWYSAKGTVFGAVGYAVSSDGLTWNKYDDEEKDPTLDGDIVADPIPVLDHGKAGSADSFAALDPSVLKDGATYKMWYTGDDSNRKRIAYATSSDGETWTKGGKVISPEDPGANANYSEGAFSPTVWKDGASYQMYLVGRKLVSGTTYATKVMQATSDDGLEWTAPSPAINPQNGKFDEDNQNSPEYVKGPTDSKMYYSGTNEDAFGNAHARIGVAEGSTNFTRFNGAGNGGSVLDIGTAETAFDARSASGLSVAAPAGATTKFTGFYWGVKGSDFIPRIGEATSSDGSSWTKYDDLDVDTDPDQIIPDAANVNQFDARGQLDPAVLYIQDNSTLTAPDYHLYFTAINKDGVKSIGYTDAQETAVTLAPDNTTWLDPSAAIFTGAGGAVFDDGGVSHPSVTWDGTTARLYYTGTSAGVTSIGCMTATNATFTAGTTAATQCLTKTTDPSVSSSDDPFDKDGVRDPLVLRLSANDYRMTYVGIEKVQDPGTDPRTIERIGYATSTDGVTWTKHDDPNTPAPVDPIFNPSQTPYSFDEVGVEPAGTLLDGTVVHYWYDGLDRTGRLRGGHATWDTAGGAPAQVENGWATYQVGSPATTVRDWQSITRTSTGNNVELWVSFLQPYSSAGKQFWSDFFPVTAGTPTEQLNFLLTVRGVRWQARLSDPAGTPSIEKVSISSAPVAFNLTGNAITKDITGPTGQTVLQWRDLTISSTVYAPNGGGTPSGTVKVLKSDGTTELKTAALTTNGDTTIDLTDINAQDNPALKVRLDLGSDGQASPLIGTLKARYYTNVSQPPVITLQAAPTTVDSGQASTLSGNVSQAGAPVANVVVTVNQRPTGSTAFTQAGTATTDSAGNYSLVVNPTATTDYQATYGGLSSSVVTVTVNQPPPPPPAITLTANPAEVIFGQTSTLGGNLSQSGAPLASQSVQILAGGAPLSTATTDAAGNYSSVVTPQANTAYTASFGGTTSAPANVGVHQLVTLKATRRGKTGTFSGKVAPAHPNKEVVIQLKKGTSFTTFVKAKTTSTSTFSVKKALKPCAKYQFRATSAADADHMDGTSVIALVEKHRVTLTVKLRGRKATFSGKVSPLHKRGTVLIKRIIGKRAAKFAKAKLTKKSTFKLIKKMKKGRYKFRADMASDRCHFAGSSKVKSVRVR